MLAGINQRVKRSAAYQQYKRSACYVILKEWQKALVRRLRLPKYLGTMFCCPICNVHLRAFKPLSPEYARLAARHGYYPLSRLETFNHSAYYCPSCDASDRERLYALHLDAVFRSFDRNRRYRVVEFAPSRALQNKLRSYPFVEHRSADLLRPIVDDRLDISDMHAYADASIDVLLCSHILEHVADDGRAMREICRVLRPDGFAIIMVPLVHGVDETCEDPAVATPEQRWRHYGSDDHVRQYGKRDFIDRLTAAGFAVEQLGRDHFGDDTFQRAGVAHDSVLYVARKCDPQAQPPWSSTDVPALAPLHEMQDSTSSDIPTFSPGSRRQSAPQSSRAMGGQPRELDSIC
jgi:SAM-dependent methyltransferase